MPLIKKSCAICEYQKLKTKETGMLCKSEQLN